MSVAVRSMSSTPIDPRVLSAAAGDRAAAESLLRELLPRVRNLVRYLVRSDPDVDDIAQHVLVALLRGFKSYRGEGSLTAWADRVTARETLTRAKRARSERARFEGAHAELELVASDDATPDVYLLRRETVRFLDALPEEQRAAIVLHHVVGMSVPELAEELSVPAETARSRLRLGMKKLRDAIRGEPGGSK